MKYSQLLKASHTKERAPSLQPETFSPAQSRLVAEGKCIHCGRNMATETSFLCPECEGKKTLSNIKQDIESLRNKIIKDHQGGL